MSGRTFQEILGDIRQGTHSYQSPADFIVQLGYGVNLYAAIRVCIEAGAFKVVGSCGPAHHDRRFGKKAQRHAGHGYAT